MARVILWFRKGLRLHDNPALVEALKGDVASLYPIFILDPEYVNEKRVGVNRFGFLLESLKDLDAKLRSKRSRLIVFQGKPTEVLEDIIPKYKISKLCFEFDTEPYAKIRDSTIKMLAEKKGVKVVSPISHTLYDPERLLGMNNDVVPGTMQSFLGLLTRVGKPLQPLDKPLKNFPQVTEISDDLFLIPSLQDLGYTAIKSSFIRGGETEALKVLQAYLGNVKKTLEFEKPKTNPAALKPDTTCLSPHLKFGCLSARRFYEEVNMVYTKAKGKHSKPPVSLLGQLYWREFFYLNGYKVKNFDRIAGNPICRLIDWDHNQQFIDAWKEGRTGYPWIDACMTQLKKDGWLHHLARHSVACFLTRGDLYQSWEHGAAVFDLHLIDADWSLNNANWMWLSASAFFHQYFRVYSPIKFAQKYDKEGHFIKKYLPVLAKFPSKYIYEPWKAPLVVQRKAGCIIGEDYPRPIVDHQIVSKRNMERMKAAYTRKLYGTSVQEPPSYSNKVAQTGSSRTLSTSTVDAKRKNTSSVESSLITKKKKT